MRSQAAPGNKTRDNGRLSEARVPPGRRNPLFNREVAVADADAQRHRLPGAEQSQLDVLVDGREADESRKRCQEWERHSVSRSPPWPAENFSTRRK